MEYLSKLNSSICNTKEGGKNAKDGMKPNIQWVLSLKTSYNSEKFEVKVIRKKFNN